jgi:hypothetical protein
LKVAVLSVVVMLELSIANTAPPSEAEFVMKWQSVALTAANLSMKSPPPR